MHTCSVCRANKRAKVLRVLQFIEEQQEEEDNAEKQVSRMRLFGSDAKALYDLDQENAARVYAVPTPLANA